MLRYVKLCQEVTSLPASYNKFLEAIDTYVIRIAKFSLARLHLLDVTQNFHYEDVKKYLFSWEEFRVRP